MVRSLQSPVLHGRFRSYDRVQARVDVLAHAQFRYVHTSAENGGSWSAECGIPVGEMVTMSVTQMKVVLLYFFSPPPFVLGNAAFGIWELFVRRRFFVGKL